MSTLYKTCMFITSFIPLWMSIVFMISADSIGIDFSTNCSEVIKRGGIISSILIINLISALYVRHGIKSAKKRSDMQFNCKIKTASKEKTITSEYLLSYILPLFAFDFTNWKEIILFLIYFIILAILCIKNNNVYANLLFEFKNYSFYNCEVQTDLSTITKQIIVISRQDLCSKIDHNITLAALNKPIYIDVNH